MDLPTLIAAALAALFAVLWLVTWQGGQKARAQIAELEAQLRELLSRRAAEPAQLSQPEPKPEPEPKHEPEPEPVPAPKPRPEDDRMRPLAAKVVGEAYEMCRYLDFSAMIDDANPSLYRTTLTLTAANAEVLRYLETGMFPCLKHFELEGETAVLHIDLSKGTP
jgi:hypothetical protein